MKNPSEDTTKNSPSQSFVKIGDAAKILGVSVKTLRRWEKLGKITSQRTPGGTRVYSLEKLQDINPSQLKYQQTPSPKKDLLSISEASEKLGVSTRTLRRWNEQGKIAPKKLPTGKLAYNHEDLEKLSQTITNDISASTPSIQPTLTPKSSFFKLAHLKFASAAVFSLSSILVITTLLLSLGYLASPKKVSEFMKGNPASSLLKPINNLALQTAVKISPKLLAEIPPEEPPPLSEEQQLNNSPKVLAVTSASQFLEINSDTQINGNLSVRDSINGVVMEGTPSANTLVLQSGNTVFSLSNSATLDQDLSTTSSPTFSSLTASSITLSSTTNQIISGNNQFSLPSSSDTLVGRNSTDTLKNKSISGSDNTLTNIPNSALVNSKITVSPGTNLTGGGDAQLGGSVSISLKDSIVLPGTLAVSGASTLTGATTIGSTLAVTGATTLSNTLDVTGATTLSSTLSVTGAATFNSTINTNTLTSTALTFSGSSPVISSANTQISLQGGVGIGYTASTTPQFPDLGLSVFGNVGIGTTSPSTKLQVIGDVSFTGNLIVGSCSGCTGSVSSVLASDGTASSPSISFASDTDSGIWRIGSNHVAFTTGGSAFSGISINSSGNVGIGTSDASYKLEVNGNTGIGGSLNVNSHTTLGSLSVSGSSNLQDLTTTNVNANNISSQTLTTSGNVNVGSSLTVSSNANLSSLNVSGVSSLTNTGITGTLNVSGNVGVGGTSTFNSLISGLSGLTINGSSILQALSATDINSSSLTTSSINTGTLNTTGNTGIGSSLTVSSASVLDSLQVTKSISGQTLGISGNSELTGNVGIGSSLTTSSVASLSSLNVTGVSSLTNTGITGRLDVSGNVGIGGSLTVNGLIVANAGVSITSLNATNKIVTPALQLTTGASSNYVLVSDSAGNGSWSTIGGSSITPDSLNFTELSDSLSLDSSTSINTNGNNLSVTGTGAVSFQNTGGFSVDSSATFNSSINTNTFTSTALIFSGSGNVNIGATASSTNLNILTGTGGLINFAGGSSSNGCTLDTTNGSFTCFGNIGLGSSGGASGFWGRSGTTLSPSFSGDSITTSGNISASGTGTITSGGTLTAQNGLTLTTGALSLTSTSGSVGLTLSSSTQAFTVNNNVLGVDTFNSRVGIGTSTPGSRLQVSGNSSIGFGTAAIAGPTNGLIVNGNVGVGTSNSSNFKLQVNGDIGPELSNTYDLGSSTNRFKSIYLSGDLNLSGGITGSNLSQGGVVYTGANGAITSTSSQFYFDSTNYRLGVGTSAPTSKLHIKQATGHNSSSGIIIEKGDTTQTWSNWMDSNNTLNWAFGSTSALPGVGQFTITSSGNVGIGTTTTSNKLHVSLSGINDGLFLNQTTANLQSFINFGDQGTVKWQIGKQSDNSWFMYDVVNSRNFLQVATTGQLVFQPVGGNVGIGASGTNPQGAFQVGPAADKFALLVFNSGNVGIGASTSSNKLDVWGNARITGTLTVDGALSASGAFKAIDGSASAPSYSFTNDTDTGIFRPSTDALGFSTGGSSRLTITAAGNVGIGATNPFAKLDISAGTSTLAIRGNGASIPTNVMAWISSSGAAHVPLELAGWSGGTQTGDIFRISSSGGGGTNGDLLTVNASGNLGINNNSPIQKFQVNSTTSSFVVTSGGNVGIGFTNPSSPLHLSAFVAHTVPEFQIDFNPSNPGCGGCTNIAQKINVLDSQGSSKTNIGLNINAANAATNYAIKIDAGQIVAADGTASAPGYSFTNDADSGLWRVGTNLVALTTAGSALNGIAVNASGNLGVGTTSPGAQVEISASSLTTLRINNTAFGGAVKWTDLIHNNGGDFVINNNRADGVGDIRFQTQAGSDRLIIKNGGNVGIGTTSPGGALIVASGNVGIGFTSPAEKLEVSGGNLLLSNNQFYKQRLVNGSAANLIGIGNDNAVRLYSTAGNLFINPDFSNGATYINYTNSNQVQVGDGTTSSNFYVAKGNIGINTTTTVAALDLRPNVTGTSIAFYSGTAGGGQFTQLGNGNIGIGTTTPTSILDLNTGATGLNLHFSRAGTAKGSIGTAIYFGTQITDDLAIRSEGSNMLFGFSGSEKMRLTSGGNVGIGWTSPGRLLDVAGIGRFGTNGENNVQLNALNQAGGLSGVTLGYNQTYNGTTFTNAAYLQAESQGVGYRNIFLSPLGGNVGIGNTTSSNKLDVWGNTRITGNLTVDGTLSQNGNISTGGVFLASDGSASAPAYSFSADTDTGLWRAGTNLVALTTAGSPQLSGTTINGISVNANGNLGIGITSPGYTLNLLRGGVSNDSSAIQLMMQAGADASLGPLEVFVGNHPSATGSNRYGFIGAGDSGAMRNLILNNNGSGSFGNVGIGTSSPTARLEVVGTDAIFSNNVNVKENFTLGKNMTSSAGQLDFYDNTNDRWKIYMNSGDTNLYFRDITNSQFVMNFEQGSAPAVVVYNKIKNADGTAAAPSYSFSNDTDTGLWRNTSNMISLTTNGSSSLQPSQTINGLSVNSTGSVGIGTTSPSAIFHVIGGSNRNGPLALIQSTGTAGGGGGFDNGLLIDISTAATKSTAFNIKNAGTSTFAVEAATGNIGVGTSLPNRQFQILGTGQLTSALTDSGNTGGTLNISQNSGSTNSGGALLFSGLNDLGTYTPQAAIKSLLLNGSSQGVGDLAFSMRASTSDTALTERMRLTFGGNLGINTGSTVAAKFHLVGDSTSTGVQFLTQNSTKTNFGLSVLDNGNIGIGLSNPISKLEVAGTGDQTVYVTTLTSGNSSLRFHNSGSNIFGFEALRSGGGMAVIDYSTGSVNPIAFFGGDGNIGIGTTAPSLPLQLSANVSGDAFNYTNSHATGNAVIQLFAPNSSTATYFGQVQGSWNSMSSPSVWQSNKAIAITASLNAPTSGMVLTTAGIIGIGTTAPIPGSKLNIIGGSLAVNDTGQFYGHSNFPNVGNSAEIGYYSGGGYAFVQGFNRGTGFIPLDLAGSYLRLDTGGSERVRIDASGNVGIGFTSPADSLYVKMPSGDNQLGISILSAAASGNGSQPGLRLLDNGGNFMAGIWSSVGASGYLAFSTNGSTEKMRLDKNGSLNIGYAGNAASGLLSVNGNVGIGTSNPSRRLELSGSGGSTGLQITDTGTDSNPLIEIKNDAQRFQLQTVGARGDAFEIYDATNGASRFNILPGGNVGIGETSPKAKFVINPGTATVGSNSGSGHLADFLSNSIGHGVTSRAVTNAFGFMNMASSTGGLWIEGINTVGNATPALEFHGGATGDTTKTTSGRGIFEFDSYLSVAPGGGGTTSNANILTIRRNGSTRDIFDDEGGLYQFTSSNALVNYIAPGNVGIGTSSTSGGLTIFGSNTSAATVPSYFFTLRGQNNNATDRFRFGETGSQDGAIGVSNADLAFFMGSTGTTRAMTLTTGGNLGIGTSNPDSLLTTYSGSGTGQVVFYGGQGLSGGVRGVFMQGYNSTFGASLIGATSAGGASRGSLSLMTNDNERIRIDVGGNVGIGFTSPIAALDVTGLNSDTTMRIRSSSGQIRIFNYQDNINYFESGSPSWTSSQLLNFTGYNANPGTFNFVGNVGINNASPSYRLDVADTASGTNADLARFIGSSDFNYTYFGGAANFGSNNSGENKWRFDVRGRPTNGGHSFGIFDMLNNAHRLFITNAGNVGISTTAPTTVLHVKGTVAAEPFQVERASNTNILFSVTNAGNVGVALQAQSSFGLCHVTNGTSTSGVDVITDCTGTISDYAEAYGTPNNAEPGDIVVTNTYDPIVTDKSSYAYQKNVVGVISTNPNDFIGTTIPSNKNPQPIGLAGRVPVKVSLENGPIRQGDFLTTSSIPGVAMKATRPGTVIGTALEDYDGTVKLSPETLLQEEKRLTDHSDLAVYHSDPNTWPSGVGKINILARVTYADPGDFMASLRLDTDGNLLMPTARTTKLLLSDDLVVDPSDLGNTLLAYEFGSSFTTDDNNGTTYGVASVNVLDSLKSLDQALVAVSDQEATNSAAIAGIQSDIASQSADLAETKNQTLSLAAQLASAAAALADTKSRVDGLELTPPEILYATDSASLTAGRLLVQSEATVSGMLRAYDLKVSNALQSLGTTSLGSTTISGNLTIDGLTSFENGNELNTIGTLYLQTSTLAEKINLFNGTFIFDKTGKLSITDTKILGSVYDPTIGSGTILAGQTKVTILNNQIKTTDKIFITPRTKTSQVISAVNVSQNQGFDAEITTAQVSNIEFDWWIIGTK